MLPGLWTAMCIGEVSQSRWEAAPQRVIGPSTKTNIRASRIQSTTGHEESRGKPGGPPSKPKNYPVTDSEVVP